MEHESAAGGAQSPRPPALDLTTEADRRMVASYLSRNKKRWPGITDEVKDAMVKGLVQAGAVAADAMANGGELALDGANTMLSAVRVAAVIEAQNQADDHLAEKYARLDAGMATEAVDHKLYSIEAQDLIDEV